MESPLSTETKNTIGRVVREALVVSAPTRNRPTQPSHHTAPPADDNYTVYRDELIALAGPGREGVARDLAALCPAHMRDYGRTLVHKVGTVEDIRRALVDEMARRGIAPVAEQTSDSVSDEALWCAITGRPPGDAPKFDAATERPERAEYAKVGILPATQHGMTSNATGRQGQKGTHVMSPETSRRDDERCARLRDDLIGIVGRKREDWARDVTAICPVGMEEVARFCARQGYDLAQTRAAFQREYTNRQREGRPTGRLDFTTVDDETLLRSLCRPISWDTSALAEGF